MAIDFNFGFSASLSVFFGVLISASTTLIGLEVICKELQNRFEGRQAPIKQIALDAGRAGRKGRA